MIRGIAQEPTEAMIEAGVPVGTRRVVHELRLSARVFRDYGLQHQDKADATNDPKEKASRQWKAKRNLDRAAACEAALEMFDANSASPATREPKCHACGWLVPDDYASRYCGSCAQDMIWAEMQAKAAPVASADADYCLPTRGIAFDSLASPAPAATSEDVVEAAKWRIWERASELELPIIQADAEELAKAVLASPTPRDTLAEGAVPALADPITKLYAIADAADPLKLVTVEAGNLRALVAEHRAFAALKEAQQPTYDTLVEAREIIFDSLYHLRVDERAKAYHERATQFLDRTATLKEAQQ